MDQNKVIRCGWVSLDPLYIKYHDEEWGKPEYDNYRLFEMLCLEGQQAGLSWITILKKRENYQKHFCKFNPYKIQKISDDDIKTILLEPGIVRHKSKLESIVNNAKSYVQMQNEGEDFSTFIWSFVNHKPIINNWSNNKEIPSQTKTSVALSKALKKRGFEFVGATICYAFMQACGLVNDHIDTCICKAAPIQAWHSNYV